MPNNSRSFYRLHDQTNGAYYDDSVLCNKCVDSPTVTSIYTDSCHVAGHDYHWDVTTIPADDVCAFCGYCEAQPLPDEQGYNGWANYETWCMNLHLSNTKWLYDQAQLISRTHYPGKFTADVLRDWVSEHLLKNHTDPNGSASRLLASDLINHALGQVDWDAVVASFQED